MPKRRSETTVTTRGKGSGIFQLNQAKQEKWLLPCFIPFPSSLHSCREFGKGIKLGKSHSSGLLKWSGKFWSNRRSKSWTTSREGPVYSGLKKPKRTFPFDFRPKFPESSAWWKAWLSYFRVYRGFELTDTKPKWLLWSIIKGHQWQSSEPIKTPSNHISPMKSVGKRVRVTYHWFNIGFSIERM